MKKKKKKKNGALLTHCCTPSSYLLKSSAHSTWPKRGEPVSLATFRRWVNAFISTDILWKKKKKNKMVRYSPTDVPY